MKNEKGSKRTNRLHHDIMIGREDSSTLGAIINRSVHMMRTSLFSLRIKFLISSVESSKN